MLKLLLFCVLLVVCWPLAVGVVIVYPFIWLFLLPFRLVKKVTGGTFHFVTTLLSLPARALRAI